MAAQSRAAGLDILSVFWFFGVEPAKHLRSRRAQTSVFSLLDRGPVPPSLGTSEYFRASYAVGSLGTAHGLAAEKYLDKFPTVLRAYPTRRPYRAGPTRRSARRQ